MDKNDKHNMNFWKDMADRLREHREPYKEGAWEQFESHYLDNAAPATGTPAHRGASVRTMGSRWKSWSAGVAAAALLLFGMIWLWPSVDPVEDPVLVQSNEGSPVTGSGPEAASAGAAAGTDAVPIEPNERTFARGASRVTSQIPHFVSATPASPSTAPDPAETLTKSGSVRNELTLARLESIQIHSGSLLTASGQELVANLSGSRPGNGRTASGMTKEKNGLLNSIFGSLNEDLSIQPGVKGDRTYTGDKWALGLSVASMMTSEQMNVGGGLSVAYKLSDRLFLRSGVSVARLGVSTPSSGNRGPSAYVGSIASGGSNGGVSGPQGPSGPTGSTGSYNGSGNVASISPEAIPTHYTRLLNGASSNLLTLDVPLDLKYFITDKFYTSLGVSFFGILNENRTNHYIDKINEPLFNGYTANGQDMEFAMRTLLVNETTKYRPLEGNGYAGFLNFSVGRQTRVSSKINLAIEPFFKLPVGRLMREEMNMTNGGIRIVTGF